MIKSVIRKSSIPAHLERRNIAKSLGKASIKTPPVSPARLTIPTNELSSKDSENILTTPPVRLGLFKNPSAHWPD
jgi:hypothetical protein